MEPRVVPVVPVVALAVMGVMPVRMNARGGGWSCDQQRRCSQHEAEHAAAAAPSCDDEDRVRSVGGIHPLVVGGRQEYIEEPPPLPDIRPGVQGALSNVRPLWARSLS
jgi:hypothetical protein